MATQKTPFSFMSDPSLNPFLRAMQPKSPFETSDEVPADAPEGSYTYKLVQSGPEVPADEVEVAVSAVEIVVRWGTTVLNVAHLTPPRSFYVGEEQGKNLVTDVFLPAEKIGASRMPVVLAERDGTVRLVLAKGATGSITLAGDSAKSVTDVLASGLAEPCAELAGGHQIALPSGSKAELEIGGISFSISTVNAGRAVGGRFQIDGRNLPFQGLSLLLHASLLAATALFMPSAAMANDDGISDEQRYLMSQAISTVAEKEMEKKDENVGAAKVDDSAGGSGRRAMFEEGKAGSTTSRNTNGRFGIQGDKDNTDPHIGKQRALADAASFGMIGLLANGNLGDPNAPIASWGRNDSAGNDARSALGNMWGDSIDEAGGANGLGLSGVGEGGGGRYEGIGMGHIGTINHGSGAGDGSEFGNGRGGTVMRGKHDTRVPVVRVGTSTVSGHLPPEVIQRIVRQNYGRFKLCYQDGLRNNPNLQGRVSVRFIIDNRGAVSMAQNGGSDLPDTNVVSCVTRAFFGLSFPAPDSGIVTVTYPIVFSPAN